MANWPTLDGWPYLRGSNPVYVTPDWSQDMAATIAATMGAAVQPDPDRVIDTGWVDAQVLPPFEARSVAMRPQLRRTPDGMVHFRGQFAPVSSLPASSSHSVIQLQPQFYPEMEHRWIGGPSLRWQSHTLGGYISESTGTLYLQPGTGPSAPIDLPTHWSIIIAPWQAAT